MNLFFYPRLALEGIRKNRRMYRPYILTCIGMVMMYYIILFLRYSDTVAGLRGGALVQGFLRLGGGVIALFAGIFLFYTNSFLIRRRKKEFGLYNILGMGKHNIGILLFWESLFTALCALGAGLGVGILFSKLAELGLVRLLLGGADYRLSVSPQGILSAGRVFGVIFGLLFVNSLLQVRFASAISLLRSESVGEKPPKANWILGLAGVLSLGGGYAIAVTAKDPVEAMMYFFAAVILVIVGTYLLMVAGSVVFCRILQRNKRYYYKAEHFVSVSSMMYRMKRNGAGLASICILATMVLVMLSSTASLYFGSEDSLRTSYPRDINLSFVMAGMDGERLELLRGEVREAAEKYGTAPGNCMDYRVISLGGYLEGSLLYTRSEQINTLAGNDFAKIFEVQLIPLEDYNALTEGQETLNEDEVMIYTDKAEYRQDTISFQNGKTYRVKRIVDRFANSREEAMSIIPAMTIFVPDLEAALSGMGLEGEDGNDPPLTFRWNYHFDGDISGEEQISLCRTLQELLWSGERQAQYGYSSCRVESRAQRREDYYGLNGGLFYLGILLSIVFTFATVLIIYYKQISEGYEDQARFGIMQKVGMTRREIRRSINSQLLTVFFLPLVGAGVHLAFAFPAICRILLLFNLNNVGLFAATTAVGCVMFALFYTLVYWITSNAYYEIVSGI